MDYDFSDYKTFKELFRDLYYKKATIDDVERKQDEITGAIMGALKAYAPRDNKYVEAKNTKGENFYKHFYKGREKIIEGFKNGVFPVYYDERHEHQMKAGKEIEEEEQEEQEKQEEQEEKQEKQEEESEERNFLNILKINQKILAIFCLSIILILKNLVIWQKNYLK